ncbi:MAG: DUF72 domain-containing protein [Granulosicoccus sp.]
MGRKYVNSEGVINKEVPNGITDNGFRYRLGLPAWAYPGWRNTYFVDNPSMLASYASVFNAVEGNTSFYHVPDASSVTSWAKALDGHDFLISFKLPRTITHESRPCMQDLRLFLSRLMPLRGHIGPFLIQFPEWVAMTQLRRFKPVFDEIRNHGDAVIEVRHPALFSQPELLEPLLAHYGFGRAMLDSRALYTGDVSHPDVLSAVHEKPDVPVLFKVYNQLVLVRLILHPDGISNARWIKEWATRTAQWINAGMTPHIMIHCPNNLYCPLFAEQFHSAMVPMLDKPMPALPRWPVPQQGQLL